MRSFLKTTTFLVVVLVIAATRASADEVQLYSQPISGSVLPIPTGAVYFGLDLCNTPFSLCVTNPLASFTSAGSSTFTASDPGFQAFVSYIANPNPDAYTFIYPFFGYQSNGSSITVGNYYYGHFQDYPGLPYNPPNPEVTALDINADQIAGFLDVGNSTWMAFKADGSEAYVTFSIEGKNLVSEPTTNTLLASGMLVLGLWGAVSRTFGRMRDHRSRAPRVV